MNKFIPGLQLSRMYYDQVVKKIINDFFPNLQYSAGLIDYGSDVLGFDTRISRDHEWGPRLSIFLKKEEINQHENRINEVLSENLPYEFEGYSTNFSGNESGGLQRLEKIEEGLVNHKIRILTAEGFFKGHLDLNIHEDIETQDWLLFPQQKLKTIRSGDIFHDDLKIEIVRSKLHFYPKDVWLYLMACEWSQIAQEEAFVGRSGDANDEIGSKLIASRIIEKIMNLCFLMEKEYAPYSKWFGTAFKKLKLAETFLPLIEQITDAKKWKDREKYLSKAYELLAEEHNNLEITELMNTKVRDYYRRPYLVIFAGRFAERLFDKITDPVIKETGLLGSIDQITNVSAILEKNYNIKKMRGLYG